MNGVEWQGYINKAVIIYFYDQERVVRRDGFLKGVSETHLFLITKEHTEAISLERIVRLEFDR